MPLSSKAEAQNSAIPFAAPLEPAEEATASAKRTEATAPSNPLEQLQDGFADLLDWFLLNHRHLPWRPEPITADRQAYAVWISETMLQQTQVATVIPYYERFMARFPDLPSLAEAPEKEVLKYWEGLGYYRRARQLGSAARLLWEKGERNLPETRQALLTLPGIGPYSAAAIASLAQHEKVAAVDGNVLRVLSRYTWCAWRQGDPADRRQASQVLEQALLQSQDPLVQSHPGLVNEALIELGALICRAKQSDCARCPLASRCQACRWASPLSRPLPAKRRSKKQEQLTALFCLIEKQPQDADFSLSDRGQVSQGQRDGELARLAERKSESGLLVQHREHQGLLAGLYQVPLLDGFLEKGAREQIAEALAERDITVGSWTHLQPKQHVFTHLIWDLDAWLIHLQPGQLPPSHQSASEAWIQTVYEVLEPYLVSPEWPLQLFQDSVWQQLAFPAFLHSYLMDLESEARAIKCAR